MYTGNKSYRRSAAAMVWWLIPLFALSACAGGNKESYTSAPASASGAVPAADSGAVPDAGMPINSPKRKIIHRADFVCKVQNVFTATTRLEQLVKSLGGVVQESHIANYDDDTRTTYYTADSLRQTKTFTTTATITLRVPSGYMDSVVNSIPGMISFLDSRTLKQSDVTYDYMANELKNRIGNSNTTTRAMQLAKKSKDPIDVQEYDDDRQEQQINRRIENMHLLDDVHYATLTLALSQPQQVYVQTIINPDYFTKPPFSLQCKAALSCGWNIIKAFTVWLLTIWPLVLVAIAGIFIWRKMWRRPLAFAKK